MGNRELIALLKLSSWCLVMVEWLFLAVPRGCLQFVIVSYLLTIFATFSKTYKSGLLLLLTFWLLLLPFWESVIVLCFVVRYFMSILVLQSS